MALTVKDWKKFQHFKDRRPPWIKLYRELLDDIEWFNLNPADAKILVMLWLIAAEDDKHEGHLPDVRSLSFRLRITEQQVEQHITNLSHWLIRDDIKMISPRYQDDTPEKRRDREETEQRREEKGKQGQSSLVSFDGWTPEQKRAHLARGMKIV